MTDIDLTIVLQTLIIAIFVTIVLLILIPKFKSFSFNILGNKGKFDNNNSIEKFKAEQDESTDKIREKINSEIRQSFKFSSKLQLTSYIENGIKKKGFRFRIGTVDENEMFFRVDLKAYLVISSLIYQPDKTQGWGRSWDDIPLTMDLLPDLTGYWTISHYFSDESPFIKKKMNSKSSEVKIYIYAFGLDKHGNRVFGSKVYNWNKTDTLFGLFQLRKLGQNKLTNEEFDNILPKKDTDRNWPLMR